MEQHSYIVTYDITSPRRWRKVYTSMHGFGQHAQLSVFFCDLTPVRLERMLGRLTELIKHDEDQILVIRIGPTGPSATDRIQVLGRSFSHRPPGPVVV